MKKLPLQYIYSLHLCLFLQYYSLDITYFKSSLDCHLLDLLWNKYWVNTLSSSPLLGNGDYVAGQISDLGNLLAWNSSSFSFISNYFSWFRRVILKIILIKWCPLHHAAEKLEQAENQLSHSRFGPLIAPPTRKKEVSLLILPYKL